MAKRKSRAVRERRAPQMYPKGAPTSSTVKAGRLPQEKREAFARPVLKTPAQEDLREEYWYVYNDLKRIAMLAGTLFAVLIALSFFL